MLQDYCVSFELTKDTIKLHKIPTPVDFTNILYTISSFYICCICANTKFSNLKHVESKRLYITPFLDS